MNLLSHQQLVKIAGFVAVGCTLAINPWFAYDPINLPKMLVLTTGASLLACALLFNLKGLLDINKGILFLFGSVFFFMTLSILINSAPLNQQILGAWGRSTGYFTYVSFLVISLSVSVFASKQDFSTLRVYLERLSYFISFYTLVQWADLDPVNWSQKLMVATLGNLNFMSSFLGIACCSFLIRLSIEKTSLSSRTFFMFMTAINLILIYVSGSIQGIAIFAAGLALLIFILVKRKFGAGQSLLFLSTSILLGLLVFFGTAGLGPLAMLRQETVLFRLDYWQAGWKMTIKNPLFGVGIDSYGDFYREFRDVEAVERTGPQRVTNTAHNIFLDVSSGAGLVAGISFFLIVVVVSFLMLKKIMQESLNEDTIAWTLILLGFLIFCLISINQIGVGVWGFIALGILISICGKETKNAIEDSKIKLTGGGTHKGATRKKSKILESKEPEEFFQMAAVFRTLTLVISLGASLFFSVAANVTDAQFLSAIKSNNLEEASVVAKRFTAMDFHKEVLVSRLSSAGRGKDSLELANEVVKQNPRSWSSWVAIFANDLSTPSQKQEAAKRLFALDPNNQAVRSELSAILDKVANPSP
jgi:O-antigen ligase